MPSDSDKQSEVIDQLKKQLENLSWRLSYIEKTRESVDQGAQLILRNSYRQLAEEGVVLPFREVGFSNYSQYDQDGILHYLFSLVGVTDASSVEMCAGVGYESNSANLVLNHGWRALMIDGDAQRVETGKKFFARHPVTQFGGPKILQRWIDRESINPLLVEEGFSGEIDLLILDLDGVDYWIWEAITEASPRVVCAEVSPVLGDRSITVPYASDFAAQWIPMKPEQAAADGAKGKPPGLADVAFYGGVSLPALIKLANRKGYRLVGSTLSGHDAFFMRNDVGTSYFPEVSYESCVNPHYDRELRARMWEVLKECDWVEV